MPWSLVLGTDRCKNRPGPQGDRDGPGLVVTEVGRVRAVRPDVGVINAVFDQRFDKCRLGTPSHSLSSAVGIMGHGAGTRTLRLGLRGISVVSLDDVEDVIHVEDVIQ